MATVTPSFSWPVPQSTDLVKDGATAIEALGDAIDASMTDLRGGTTGQILAKATNADMDFAWITNDVGDITEVTAGTGITGGGTSGAVTVSFDQANFGGGQFAAGKNKIINGDFGIWQRGTTLTDPAGASFLADRFKISYDGTAPTSRTYSQETFTLGAAPVAGYEGKFFARVAVTTKGSNTRTGLFQNIEGVRTFAGQTITVSFWAKCDTARAGSIQVSQNFGGGGSPSSPVVVTNTAVSYTSSWARYTLTVAIPSISGKTLGTNGQDCLEIVMFYTSADSSTFDIWGVQVEAGSVATPFQTATGTIQGELAACQRYYYRKNSELTAGAFGIGQCFSTTQATVLIPHPVTMRTTPTLARSGLALTNATGTRQSVSAISNNGSNVNTFSADFTTTGIVAGNATTLVGSGTSTTDYIEASAEL